jgi:hypothetical protein
MTFPSFFYPALATTLRLSLVFPRVWPMVNGDTSFELESLVEQPNVTVKVVVDLR